jgi:hypothetical protein
MHVKNKAQALLDCDQMSRLSCDEIASMLLARLLREAKGFAARSSIDENAKPEEVWRRFVKYQEGSKVSKQPKPRVAKRPNLTKGHDSI